MTGEADAVGDGVEGLGLEKRMKLLEMIFRCDPNCVDNCVTCCTISRWLLTKQNTVGLSDFG